MNELLFVAGYVGATVAFLPAVPLTLGAGALWGLKKGFLLVSAGSTLGAVAAFLVSRTALRGWVEGKLGADPRLRALDKAVAREGWRAVALLRLSPVIPFNLLNYAFGLTKVPLGPYALASWLAMMPGTLLYVWLGAAAGDAARGQASPAKWALTAVGLAATAAAVVLVSRAAKQALAEDSV